jgi:hypothetical protein
MKALMAATVLAAMAATAPAAAQPPNDDFDNATEIDGLAFSDIVDTTEATTADDDPFCNGQGTTVWYAFSPSEDVAVAADTFGSDYDTTLSVYTGTRGALEQLACNDEAGGTAQSRVRFDAIAGETYFFMVASFAGGPGGALEFSVDVAPPPLVIDLSIDRRGRFVSETGEAVISGTLTCSEPASGDVFLELRQDVGRFIIRGFGATSFACEGETAWSATVMSDDGLFRGGPAKVSAFASAFLPETGETGFDDAFANVRLSGGRI